MQVIRQLLALLAAACSYTAGSTRLRKEWPVKVGRAAATAGSTQSSAAADALPVDLRAKAAKWMARMAKNETMNGTDCEELLHDLESMSHEMRQCIESPTCFEAKEKWLGDSLNVILKDTVESGCAQLLNCDTLRYELEAYNSTAAECATRRDEIECSDQNEQFLSDAMAAIEELMRARQCLDPCDKFTQEFHAANDNVRACVSSPDCTESQFQLTLRGAFSVWDPLRPGDTVHLAPTVEGCGNAHLCEEVAAELEAYARVEERCANGSAGCADWKYRYMCGVNVGIQDVLRSRNCSGAVLEEEQQTSHWCKRVQQLRNEAHCAYSAGILRDSSEELRICVSKTAGAGPALTCEESELLWKQSIFRAYVTMESGCDQQPDAICDTIGAELKAYEETAGLCVQTQTTGPRRCSDEGEEALCRGMRELRFASFGMCNATLEFRAPEGSSARALCTRAMAEADAACPELIRDQRETNQMARHCISSPTCFEKQAEYLIRNAKGFSRLEGNGCVAYLDCDALQEELEAFEATAEHCAGAEAECSTNSKGWLCWNMGHSTHASLGYDGYKSSPAGMHQTLCRDMQNHSYTGPSGPGAAMCEEFQQGP